MILLVVLALLVLFAMVGMAFVVYADSHATAARIWREGDKSAKADVDPEMLLSYYLGQLVYDAPDDPSGIYSAMRGHSLARSMYGWNSGPSPYQILANTGVTVSPTPPVAVTNLTGVAANGQNYTITTGSQLLIDSGANQELVTVTAVNTATNQITALFTKAHASGVPVDSYPGGIILTYTSGAINPSAQSVPVSAIRGTYEGVAWQVKSGDQLVVDAGKTNQETVTLTGASGDQTSGTISAVFTKSHAAPFYLSGLQPFSVATTAAVSVTSPGTAQYVGVTATNGVTNSYSWAIKPGMQLLVDAGQNQELVTVSDVNTTTTPPQIQAPFFRSHPTGASLNYFAGATQPLTTYTGGGNIAAGTQTFPVTGLTGTSGGLTYKINVGSELLVKNADGSNPELVIATAVQPGGTPTITAIFTQTHAPGATISYVPPPNYGAITAALAEVNLSRKLPAYPLPQESNNPKNYQIPVADLAQYDTALKARQDFAREIFDALRQLTGAANPASASPGSPEFNALRYLAQLAVNIVDYVDGYYNRDIPNNDYNTLFNWGQPFGYPNEWVYGTRMTHLVLNEAYVQIANDRTDTFAGDRATKPYKVNFWVELYNPFSDGKSYYPNKDQFYGSSLVKPNIQNDGAARLQVPPASSTAYSSPSGYAVYQVVMATTKDAGNTVSNVDYLRQPDNVLGNPAPGTYVAGQRGTAVSNWQYEPFVAPNGPAKVSTWPPAPSSVATYRDYVVLPASGAPSGPQGGNQGFYLTGPINDFNSTNYVMTGRTSTTTKIITNLDDSYRLQVGMRVTAPGTIPDNSTIASIDSPSQITYTNPGNANSLASYTTDVTAPPITFSYGPAAPTTLVQYGTTSSSTQAITKLTDVSKLQVGMPVSGNYIGATSYIVSIDTASKTVTLNSGAIARSFNNIPVTFGVVPSLRLYDQMMYTQTGSVSSGSTTVTGLSDTSQYSVGMVVTGTVIPYNTTVASIPSATSVTLSASPTGIGSYQLTFAGPTSYTQNGTLASSSATVTGLPDTSKLRPGMQVQGYGIPANTTIATVVDATSITLSSSASQATTTPLTFYRVNGTRSSMVYELPLNTSLDQSQSYTILLQRLAVPGLPPQPDATKPRYNPYVTVDYLAQVPANIDVRYDANGARQTVQQVTGTMTNASPSVTGLTSTSNYYVGMPFSGTGLPAGTTIASVNSATSVTLSNNYTGANGPQTLTFDVSVNWTQRSSVGRLQPYAADASQQVNQQAMYSTDNFATTQAINPAGGGYLDQPQNSFFQRNNPATLPYDWLFMATRKLVSTPELLQVSGYKQQELTQMFMTGGYTVDSNNSLTYLPNNKYTQRAPWLTPSPIVEYGTLTNGSPVVTGLSDTSKMGAGMPVSGTGIPSGTYIASVDSPTQVTLSATPAYAGNAQTGTLTNGSNTVTNLASTTNYYVGMPVSGGNLPGNTTVTAVSSGNSLTVSTTYAGATGNYSLTFGTPTSCTQTPTLTNGSPTVRGLTGTSQLYVGMPVQGAGIASNTYVAAILSATTATLSSNYTGTTGQQPVTFYSQVPLTFQLSYTQTGAVAGRTVTFTAPASTGYLSPGMQVSGAGIPAYDTIASVDSPTQLTLSYSSSSAGNQALTFTPTSRLYRAFEVLSPNSYIMMQPVGGRVTGKININDVWDQPTINALADATSANYFTAGDVTTLYQKILAQRSPEGMPGANDRPFYSPALSYTALGDNQWASNTLPFSGIGQLSYLLNFSGVPNAFQSQNNYNLVNYTYYASDNFLRDAERYGVRSGPQAERGPYVSGNVPYTYPDVNNMYLAAVRASDGAVLTPSFYRSSSQAGTLTSGSNTITNLASTTSYYAGMSVSAAGLPANTTVTAVPSSTSVTLSNAYAGTTGNYLVGFGSSFGPLSPSNANWYAPNADMTNAGISSLNNLALKYLTLRPTPGSNAFVIDTASPDYVLAAPANVRYFAGQNAYAFDTNGTTSLPAGTAIRYLFPATLDSGGDVKNLADSPGYLTSPSGATPQYANSDSIWLDLGFPVATAPDGRKYKPLFAALIEDLDNRVNLNYNGNVRGSIYGVREGLDMANGASSSVQGYAPFEVNVQRVLTAKEGPNFEARRLFIGAETSLTYGNAADYNGTGYSYLAGTGSAPASGSQAYQQAQGKYDAWTWGLVTNKNLPSEVEQSFTGPFYNKTAYYAQPFPATYNLGTGESQGNRGVIMAGRYTTPSTSAFPDWSMTYNNGYLGCSDIDYHPMLFNYFSPRESYYAPGAMDRTFPLSELEALLRYGDKDASSLTSDLYLLVPQSLQNPQARRLVTLRSMDIDRPGVIPYSSDVPAGSTLKMDTGLLSPTGNAAVSPALPGTAALPRTGQDNSVFQADPSDTSTGQQRRLFEPNQVYVVNPATGQPYADNRKEDLPWFKMDLLTKVYNSMTNRSNVFAVWVTVGFFEVMDDTNPNRPPVLGPELGRAENKQVRHKMFAILDRTNLTVSPSNPTEAGPRPFFLTTEDPVVNPGQATIRVGTLGLSGSYEGLSYNLKVGDQLVIGHGKDQETVTVSAVANGSLSPGNPGNSIIVRINLPTITATFAKAHPTGTSVSNGMPGNPGPQPRFSVRDAKYSGIVPFYSISQ